jgi:hypothetical protein
MLSDTWVVTCRADRVVDGEDAGGRVVLVFSSHTFPAAGHGVECPAQTSSGGFVVTLSLDLQLINEGFRLQHRLPLTPVRVAGRRSCDAG